MTIRSFKTVRAAARGPVFRRGLRIASALITRGLRELLDLATLNFCHADRDGGAGQPPYDHVWLPEPGAFVASARARGGAQCGCDVAAEGPGARLPDDRQFRKDNIAALKAANRDFVLVLRELELLGGDLVAMARR